MSRLTLTLPLVCALVLFFFVNTVSSTSLSADLVAKASSGATFKSLDDFPNITAPNIPLSSVSGTVDWTVENIGFITARGSFQLSARLIAGSVFMVQAHHIDPISIPIVTITSGGIEKKSLGNVKKIFGIVYILVDIDRDLIGSFTFKAINMIRQRKTVCLAPMTPKVYALSRIPEPKKQTKFPLINALRNLIDALTNSWLKDNFQKCPDGFFSLLTQYTIKYNSWTGSQCYPPVAPVETPAEPLPCQFGILDNTCCEMIDFEIVGPEARKVCCETNKMILDTDLGPRCCPYGQKWSSDGKCTYLDDNNTPFPDQCAVRLTKTSSFCCDNAEWASEAWLLGACCSNLAFKTHPVLGAKCCASGTEYNRNTLSCTSNLPVPPAGTCTLGEWSGGCCENVPDWNIAALNQCCRLSSFSTDLTNGPRCCSPYFSKWDAEQRYCRCTSRTCCAIAGHTWLSTSNKCCKPTDYYCLTGQQEYQPEITPPSVACVQVGNIWVPEKEKCCSSTDLVCLSVGPVDPVDPTNPGGSDLATICPKTDPNTADYTLVKACCNTISTFAKANPTHCCQAPIRVGSYGSSCENQWSEVSTQSYETYLSKSDNGTPHSAIYVQEFCCDPSSTTTWSSDQCCGFETGLQVDKRKRCCSDSKWIQHSENHGLCCLDQRDGYSADDNLQQDRLCCGLDAPCVGNCDVNDWFDFRTKTCPDPNNPNICIKTHIDYNLIACCNNNFDKNECCDFNLFSNDPFAYNYSNCCTKSDFRCSKGFFGTDPQPKKSLACCNGALLAKLAGDETLWTTLKGVCCAAVSIDLPLLDGKTSIVSQIAPIVAACVESGVDPAPCH
jgi:hypothetical protein